MSTSTFSNIRVLALFGLIATLGPAAVKAQSSYHFTIPFGFTVASKSFAAGDYLVSEVSPHVILVRSNDGHGGVMVGANGDQRGKAANKATLTFHKYGDQCFLSSVSDDHRGWKLPEARAEKELIAGKASPQPLQVIASSGK